MTFPRLQFSPKCVRSYGPTTPFLHFKPIKILMPTNNCKMRLV